MAVNPLANPPSPPNANMDRAMFVWVPQVGGATDPLGTDAKQNTLLGFCGNNGINVIFLDIWRYLGGGNWSAANQSVVKKFCSIAHASGIRVFALAGDSGWGQNQQWVMRNILKPIEQFNSMGEMVNTAYEGGWFDGVMFDVEYWATPGYGAADPQGLCDLMIAAKRLLNIPVGCFATQWLADGASAAVSFSWNGGPTQLEGLNLMEAADFVCVGCYSNNSATQIAMFANWYNYASQSGKNFGLWCGSETGQGLGTLSYWTGAVGAKAAMETAHTAISAAYTAAPSTNCSFRGQAIHAYDPYNSMT